MAKLIINTATRIIHCVTTNPNPQIDATKQSLVDVADNYLIQGEWSKLLPDNVSQTPASAAEISAYKDDYDSTRDEIRTLRQTGLALFNAPTSTPELKAFLLAFRNWVKAPS